MHTEPPNTSARQHGARVGVFAVGHQTYWGQFEGLLARLMGFHATFAGLVAATGVEVVDYGMVDTNATAYRVADQMMADGLDLVFCNLVTYATSSVVAPIARNVACPMVLAALQPRSAMDYTRASTVMQLENDNICSVPEFVGVATRLGHSVRGVVLGTLHGDDAAAREVAEWCSVAKALRGLKGARLGLMGHVLESMYDMHADPTALSAALNIHVPLLEIDDLVRLYAAVTDDDIAAKEAHIASAFAMPEPVGDPLTERLTPQDLREAARAAVALDRLVDEHNLTGLAYYYEGLEDSPQRTVASSLIVGNSMLNARGVPMCGEYDIKTCVAMLILDRLGAGGSFAEFHPFDFTEGFILVGHDGPHHTAIAEGKPILRSLTKYHGKPGHGASVEFKIREGPITMLGLTQKADGKLKFVIGEGTSRKGPIPPTGNTNTRAFFEPNTRDFVKAWVMEGPTHHFALGIGHVGGIVKRVGEALGIEGVIVRV